MKPDKYLLLHIRKQQEKALKGEIKENINEQNQEE